MITPLKTVFYSTFEAFVHLKRNNFKTFPECNFVKIFRNYSTLLKEKKRITIDINDETNPSHIIKNMKILFGTFTKKQ